MCGFQSLVAQFPSERIRERRYQYNDVKSNKRRKTCNSSNSPERRVAELQNILTGGANNDSNVAMLDGRQQDPYNRTTAPNPLSGDNFLIKDTLSYHNIDPTNLEPLGDHHYDQQRASIDSEHEIYQKEWQLMAKILDRVFFVSVFTIMTTAACLILLSPWYITSISENLKLAKEAAAREREQSWVTFDLMWWLQSCHIMICSSNRIF